MQSNNRDLAYMCSSTWPVHFVNRRHLCSECRPRSWQLKIEVFVCTRKAFTLSTFVFWQVSYPYINKHSDLMNVLCSHQIKSYVKCNHFGTVFKGTSTIKLCCPKALHKSCTSRQQYCCACKCCIQWFLCSVQLYGTLQQHLCVKKKPESMVRCGNFLVRNSWSP